MFLFKKHLSRRTILKGAGATIALPLLDAMVPAGTALAQTAAAASPRLGFVYFPHGALQEEWTPTKTGRDFDFPFILEPLEPYREYVTVVSGLRNKGGESSQPARHRRGNVAQLRQPAPAQCEDRRRDHRGPDRREASGEGHAAAVAGTVRRAGRHDLVPNAESAAADGEQSAEGVLQHVRPGRYEGGARGHSEHDRQPARLRAGVDGHAEPQARCRRPRQGERLPGFGARDRAARAEARGERQVARAICRMRRSVRPRTSASCSTFSSR